jgi:signal transduction histidine kinase
MVTPVLVRLRLWVVLLSLLIVGYHLALVLAIPDFGFDYYVPASGALEVMAVRDVNGSLREGDLILAVNGIPTESRAEAQWMFPFQPEHHYLVQRGQGHLTVSLATQSVTVQDFLERALPLFVAVTTWLIGALILLLATPRNGAAWRAGYVFIGMGVVLASFMGRAYFLPGGRLGFDGLMPIVAVAFAELALFPDAQAPSKVDRIVFTSAYGLALILSLASAIDVFVLQPAGQSLYHLTGIALWPILLLHAAGFLTAFPVMILVRYLRARRSQRQQELRILMLGAALAIGPLVVVVILPRVFNLIGPTDLWIGCLVFFIFLPASYGYVIYRHRYLNLDIVVTRTMAWLFVGMTTLLSYLAFVTTWRTQPGLGGLEPIAGSLFVSAALVIAPLMTRRSSGFITRLLHGPHAAYQPVLAQLVSTLTANPDIEMLRWIFGEATRVLQVRAAALFLLDEKGTHICMTASPANAVLLPTQGSALLPRRLTTRSAAETEVGDGGFLYRHYPWAEVMAPVLVEERLIGLLVLGPRIPDGAFNSFQLKFIDEVSSAIGLVYQSIQLFEASRAMSRELMRVRDAERTQLAAKLHDDPLQRISAVANSLERLAGQLSSPLDAALAQTLLADRESLCEAAAQVREICAGLRPPVLNEGLEWALHDVVHRLRSEGRIKAHTCVQVPLEAQLAEEATIAVYHVVAESLNNVRKHAGASNVWIDLQHRDGKTRLSISDDGCGANVDGASLAALVRARHFGLVGMYEWARVANGSLTIAPREGGQGTTVTLTC